MRCATAHGPIQFFLNSDSRRAAVAIGTAYWFHVKIEEKRKHNPNTLRSQAIGH